MGVKFHLTPQAVRRFLHDKKHSFDSRLSHRHIQEICKYGAVVGSTIHQFDYLDRGMDKARKIIGEYEEEGKSFPSGMVIAADSMTMSVGRFGREWHAPVGGIWLALVMVNTLIPSISRLYPLAAGVACCEFIRSYHIDARLKWVNDIHVRGKKMAGILTETHIGRNSKEEYIIIGLGINVNNQHFPPALEQEAGSMSNELGHSLNLSLETGKLLADLAWNIGLLCFDERKKMTAAGINQQHGSLLLARWRQLSDTMGRKVQFGFNAREIPQYEATVTGLDETGGLRLMLADGSLLTEHGGEIIYLD